MPADWYLYLIRTRDGALYTGIATDVDRRLAEHRAGAARASKYLRSRTPLTVVYRTKVGNRALALRVEGRIKRLAKSRKEKIVAQRPGRATLLKLLAISEP